jgi:glutathione S-transferase
MITVHHLNHSRSQRILWLLEELQLDYDIQRYERDPKTMLAPASLRAVHPLGKSPVITDGDLTIAESGAIVDYLIDRYGAGRLAPARGTAERLRYTYWLHYAEGSLMPLLVMKLVFGQIPRGPMPFIVRPVARTIVEKVQAMFLMPQLTRHFAYLEGELGKSSWFAGEAFTAADIQMSFPIEAAAARGGLDRAKQPRLHAFLERIHARPGYQRALTKGGEFKVL